MLYSSGEGIWHMRKFRGRAELINMLVEQLPMLSNRLGPIQIDAIERDVIVNDVQLDCVITMRVGTSPVRLFVEARSGGWPRDVYPVIEKLKPLSKTEEGFRFPNGIDCALFVAPQLGITARKALDWYGIGYLDQSGAMSIHFPFKEFERFGEPVPEPRRNRELYRGSAAAVVHTLLHSWNRLGYDQIVNWKGIDLAAAAGVAPSTVSRICSALSADGLLKKVDSGPNTRWSLWNPGELLDDWKESFSLEQYETRWRHGWEQTDEKLISSVASALEDCAIDYRMTLHAGASFLAPFVTRPLPVAVIVPKTTHLAEVEKRARLQHVDGQNDGGNVLFLMTDEPAPFLHGKNMNGVNIASAIQMYLDLSHWPQRGVEQADHLRRQVIGF